MLFEKNFFLNSSDKHRLVVIITILLHNKLNLFSFSNFCFQQVNSSSKNHKRREDKIFHFHFPQSHFDKVFFSRIELETIIKFPCTFSIYQFQITYQSQSFFPQNLMNLYVFYLFFVFIKLLVFFYLEIELKIQITINQNN